MSLGHAGTANLALGWILTIRYRLYQDEKSLTHRNKLVKTELCNNAAFAGMTVSAEHY